MSHSSQSIAAPRLPSLTGLRFIAAALVFFHHGIWANVLADPSVRHGYYKLFINAGHAGVSFFFILSGFVLTFAAKPNDTLRSFWRRRVAKVYPNHLVTFVLALVLIAPPTELYQALANLFLVQAWVPRYNVLFSVDVPSWSLACEAVFYLSFPLLLARARRIREDRLWWWVGAVLVAVLAATMFARYVLPATPGMPDGQPIGLYQFWFVYAFPPVRALDFVLGILMARIVQSGRWIRLPLPAAVITFIAAYAVAMVLPYVYGLGVALVAPLALVVTAAAVADLEGNASPLRGRTMIWLGEISYAFYLMHVIVLVWARGKLGGADHLWGTWPAICLLAAGFALSVLAAWVLYTTVESPVMKRWSRPRRPTPLPAPTSEQPIEPVAQSPAH